MGTLTMSAKASNETVNTITPKQPLAFQLEEGQLSVEVDGESAQLIQGDVLFVPTNTTFSYYATVPVTKFLYVSGGVDGFDQDLLQTSVEWEFAVYPTYAGYTA
ncbi:Quercetin -dioxygenase [Phytophthora cinnamomi]|uniref:Quercetin -dioxygenase n=1 Tax=Phytophthora cinnamomi TaxID=4785 RepID=UPI0035597DD9|nr:Quercetin -dioxygenase [Phytophthora cinnamomi]